MRARSGIVVLRIVLWLVVPFAASAQPAAPIARHDTVTLQFRHISIKDGLSQGMVHAITQDRYGFMWFGTKDGLNRYDGYSFTVYRHDPADSTTVRNSFINAVLEDRAGRLWVGTPTGLDVFDRATETFHHLPSTDEFAQVLGATPVPVLQGHTVNHLACDALNNIWVSTNHGITRIAAKAPNEPLDGPWGFTYVHSVQAIQAVMVDSRGWLRSATDDMPYAIDTRDPELRVHAMVEVGAKTDPNAREEGRPGNSALEDTVRGRLYNVHNRGVMEVDPATNELRTLFEISHEAGIVTGHGALVDANGALWLPTRAGNLTRIDPQKRRVTSIQAEAPEQRAFMPYVKCVFRDRNGLIWLGLSGYGLLTYDPRIERFNVMPGPSVRYMVPGNNGKVVLCEGNFMSQYDPKQRAYDWRIGIQEVRARTRFTEGFFGNDAVLQDRSGAYWAGKGGLVRYDHEKGALRRAIPKDASDPALPANSSCFPLKLIDDTIWFGVDSGLFWFDPVSERYGRWPYPVTPVNNPYLFVQGIHRDPQGVFWLASVKGLFRFHRPSGKWEHHRNDPDDPESLSVDILFSIIGDPKEPEHYLWIGTNGGGLNRFDTRTGKVKRYTTKEGLPNDVVYGVLADEDGQLWMSTNKGIARFDPVAETFRQFTAGDGLQNDEFNRYGYCKLADGTLCFAGVGGLNTFDPKELKDDTRPAIVRITDIKLRNRSIVLRAEGSPLTEPPFRSTGMAIPYSDNMVTFEFATMEFSAPGAHRYQYKLEGFDADWIATQGIRSAIYTNLDPGTYTFRVRGSNRDGYWDEQGTAFMLVVHPPWWRTWWFYALCGIVAIGGVLAYTGSLRRTVRIRTSQLRREKDRSEDLLNNILPRDVAAELKQKGATEAVFVEEAAVLFTDFKDFTGMSGQLSAEDLVRELNICFSAFDRIMEKHGLEKIKTIGDAYLAVGGVPKPLTDAALHTVLAALEMQETIAERRTERMAQGQVAFAMRAGVHTGPVVAGVVGQQKFQYDIWGGTVDTAHALEASSEVDQVTISAAAYEQVKGVSGLAFTALPPINARGGGSLARYRVERIVASSGAPEAAPTRPMAPRQSVRTASSAVDPKGMRILLVEDNEFNALVARTELEEWYPGARVDHALNGAKAVELVKGNRYHVVLMDIQMPVMDGYDATRAIRALSGDKANTPIIAMTANVMAAERQRCFDAGMDGFIPKPFKKEDLLGEIGRVVG
ncbi:MAG: response regulator [Flavobacteriales bacterium]|nr:response regulator [Flavobacteriales bacterium]